MALLELAGTAYSLQIYFLLVPMRRAPSVIKRFHLECIRQRAGSERTFELAPLAIEPKSLLRLKRLLRACRPTQ